MKKQIFKIALVASVVINLVSPTLAQTYNGKTLEGSVTYVPVGTTIDTALTSPIDSAVAKPGDVFNAKVLSPLYLGSDLVLPANSNLEGIVSNAEKGGRMGINGTTQLRLTAAVTPDGIRYPLSAVISANQNQNQKGINQTKDGTIKGSSTKASVGTGAARVAAWTAGGTLLGIIFAPIVAGSVGIGAIAGVATGAGVGLGSDLWRKGKEVTIPSGTKLTFQLDQPMSLTTGIASARR